MFTPNLIGKLARQEGFDGYGMAKIGMPVDCPFAIINLKTGSKKTSVRADSSGSRGAADNIATDNACILVPAYTEIGVGDRFTYLNVSYDVVNTNPRFSISGQLDHIEIDLEIVPS